MAYTSLWKKPNEYASKSSHHFIINDVDVKDFLKNCSIPYSKNDFEIDESRIIKFNEKKDFPIKNIITIDWWYQETYAQKWFPSSMVAFFQFGVNLLKIDDIHDLDWKAFIWPEEISKLRNLDRFKLVLPLKNISYKGQSFLYSTRKSIYDFFKKNDLLDAVYWLIFEEFSNSWEDEYTIDQNPINKNKEKIIFTKSNLDGNYILNYNWEEIFITDVFRLHEVIDEEIWANWILWYLTPLIKQFFLIKIIKSILENSPSILNNTLFIRDWFLWFSWQTARLHKSMRSLIKFLFEKHNLYLVWIEKSWAFVEHAIMLNSILKNDKEIFKAWTWVILTNNYIYKYIVPKLKTDNLPYASTSYYSWKLILKTFKGNVLVATVPTISSDCFLDEKLDIDWYKNIDVIFNILDYLECNYYDNSLLPIALVNKMVSLSNKPSSQYLEQFLKWNIK
jgi:hypothetical protein